MRGEPIVTNRVVLSGSFNPLHDGHQSLLSVASNKYGSSKDGSCFEMALKNADKGTLSADDPSLLARIKQFTEREQALVLSNEGLFIQKAMLMPSCDFVIGYDTYVRILNPRYYGESEQNMIAAL
mmetsp:Transcript_10261/g.12090  ORF Transcript_10261/g.12090 Transcript_10261/m.12090 type:complete len:125 (+) Transcript_10261:140-514(+)